MEKEIETYILVSREKYNERGWEIYEDEVVNGVRKERNDLFFFHLMLSKGMCFAYSGKTIIDLSAHVKNYTEDEMIKSIAKSITHEYLHHALWEVKELDEGYHEDIVEEMLGG